MRSSVTSGPRAPEPASIPQSRPCPSVHGEPESNIYCYTSLDRPMASAAVEAVNARLAIDLGRDFVVSKPAVLGKAYEEIIREHTADSKRTVFHVRLAKTSPLSAENLFALVRALRRGLPDLLVLWENELRL